MGARSMPRSSSANRSLNVDDDMDRNMMCPCEGSFGLMVSDGVVVAMTSVEDVESAI